MTVAAKKCGCTTSGFGDYLEHCGGIILTVVEGVFGLNFDSTTDYAAEIDRASPMTGRTLLRTSPEVARSRSRTRMGHILNTTATPTAGSLSALGTDAIRMA